MIRALVDVLYPARCVFCGARLGRGDSLDREVRICGDCQTSLPWVAEDTPEVRAPWLYRDAVRKAIHRFKFSGVTPYARTFGAVMAQCVKPGDYDAVAWVPCSWLRRQKRRFDQSRLLAVHVARTLDKPLIPLLARKRHGKAQYRAKHAGERKENVKRAFVVRQKAMSKLPPGARILLVDDIYTTGATFAECKRVILEAGAKSVTLLAAAKRKREIRQGST